MRFLLALLAVIGLLASPVAAAAQARCYEHVGAQMMNMATGEMPTMVHAGGQKAHPCCDPVKDHGRSKHRQMDCMQACATVCGLIAALPGAPVTLIALPVHESTTPARVAFPKPHEPGRLERPPRSIA